jgi:hypothetical protein
MAITEETQDTGLSTYPSRFREAEGRSARIGRPLRLVAGVREVDEGLMHEIGTAYFAGDDLGARLAQAMRTRAGTPGGVTRDQLETGLAHGSQAVPDAAPALRDFLAELEATPEWVDWDRISRGQRAYLHFGQNAADVLLQLSLIGGYRFGGPTDLLVATGGLTGQQTLRRLAETQHWTMTLSTPDGLRPHGQAWRLTAQVRVMHAMVNEAFTPRWDVARWGLPINQADQAATLGLFDATVLLGVRALGVPVTRQESDDIMHLWRYVGWLLGVDERFLVDTERERHRLDYHLLLAQADLSEAGPLLARALVAAQDERHYRRFPSLRGRFERERLLSMLTLVLGRRSMRELGLPLRPPWAPAYIFALNTWRYRTSWGRRRLDGWSRRMQERTRREHFGPAEPELGRA